METIFWICGFYALACAGVWISEHIELYQMRDLLPPPDRSTQRNAESLDQQDQYIKRMERQS